MQFLVVVSDFPKVTETFVLRNVMHYLKAGHAVTVFHTKPYRDAEVVHSTYAPVVERSLDLPWLPRAAFRELVRSPGRVLSVLSQIVVAFARDPRHLAVSLVLMPKSLGLAAHVRSAGLTHIHAEFAGYPATVAWIVSRLTGVPFSFSAHAHDIFITQGLLATKARDAAFVRAISEFNKRFLERLPGFPSNKVEVLRCGVEVPTDVAAPPTGPFRIVFVGALLARKGVDVLLDAVAGLPNTLDWRLDIVGGGSQEAALRRQVEGLPDGRVRFLGPQPSGEVQAAMVKAHVVVVPSREGASGRSEGIPVVLMEAMSLARPVIASRLSGIPELVEDGTTGLLVPPDDADALTAALRRLADDPALAERLAAAGRKRVAEAFDIEQTAAQLLARMKKATAT